MSQVQLSVSVPFFIRDESLNIVIRRFHSSPLDICSHDYLLLQSFGNSDLMNKRETVYRSKQWDLISEVTFGETYMGISSEVYLSHSMVQTYVQGWKIFTRRVGPFLLPLTPNDRMMVALQAFAVIPNIASLSYASLLECATIRFARSVSPRTRVTSSWSMQVSVSSI
jgi:hypothetical protein